MNFSRYLLPGVFATRAEKPPALKRAILAIGNPVHPRARGSVGLWAVTEVARRLGLRWGLTSEVPDGAVAARSNTFFVSRPRSCHPNASLHCLTQTLHYGGISAASNITVIHADPTLPVGEIRITLGDMDEEETEAADNHAPLSFFTHLTNDHPMGNPYSSYGAHPRYRDWHAKQVLGLEPRMEPPSPELVSAVTRAGFRHHSEFDTPEEAQNIRQATREYLDTSPLIQSPRSLVEMGVDALENAPGGSAYLRRMFRFSGERPVSSLHGIIDDDGNMSEGEAGEADEPYDEEGEEPDGEEGEESHDEDGEEGEEGGELDENGKEPSSEGGEEPQATEAEAADGSTTRQMDCDDDSPEFFSEPYSNTYLPTASVAKREISSLLPQYEMPELDHLAEVLGSPAFYRIRVGVRPLESATLFRQIPVTFSTRLEATHTEKLTLLNPFDLEEIPLVRRTLSKIYEHCKKEYDAAT